jgi:hypothetical protein
MSINMEELAHKVEQISARVESAVAEWKKSRARGEEMRARRNFTRADVQARLAAMPTELREEILALGEKYARRDLSVQSPSAKQPKVPRRMV